jgi:hypothetical protein
MLKRGGDYRLNKERLKTHITDYLKKLKDNPQLSVDDLNERRERIAYYQSWTAERLKQMTPEDFTEYLAKLWAMRIWGNKQYVVDKLIEDNGFPAIVNQFSELVWSDKPIAERWDRFLKTVKGVGPAMISEILCHTHPEKYMLWNRRAYVALNHLGVENLPRYNYQHNGKKYEELCIIAKIIAKEIETMGAVETNLLTVDYFIWDQLQVEENLSRIYKPKPGGGTTLPGSEEDADPVFIHNEIRDKIADIGRWLGFETETEKKVAGGAVVDTIWESTIGNMGRVIYVFEVQTKGSHDSLILNLIKALNNPAVQGVVAVSDPKQLEKIKAEIDGVSNLKDKLKYWDYMKVLEVHEALEFVNEEINSLGLVPQGF